MDINKKFTKNSQTVSETTTTGRTGIFITIFAIIFFIAFARILFGGQPFTFTGFLNRITTAPDLTLPTQVLDFAIGGNWLAFDFLRVFLNSMIGVVNFAVYFTGLILNLIVILIWALGFLLGF